MIGQLKHRSCSENDRLKMIGGLLRKTIHQNDRWSVGKKNQQNDRSFWVAESFTHQNDRHENDRLEAKSRFWEVKMIDYFGD